MTPYLHPAGTSGVTHYEIGPDVIRVKFRDGDVYRYGPRKPGRRHVEQMKRLAVQGSGLATYINQHVRENYEAKES